METSTETVSPIAPAEKRRMVWRNGRLCEASEAALSPFDHGLLTGDGVFETLIAYRGIPFAERRHYERLCRSAAGLGLPVPEAAILGAAMREVLDANELDDKGRIRITITGGESPLGSDRGDAEATVLVAASGVPAFASSVAVITVPYARNEKGALSGLKTTSYGENVVALKRAREAGAGEAIFGNTAGYLCEGTGTNIFAVVDGRLMTPPLESGCLAGVTRALVLELCAQEGIPVDEVLVPLETLATAEEAFLSSTLREVQAIEKVDDTVLPRVPGPITQKMASAFRSLAERDPNP